MPAACNRFRVAWSLTSGPWPLRLKIARSGFSAMACSALKVTALVLPRRTTLSNAGKRWRYCA
ncbi:hypothetical protein D3C84_1171290 [compost metagenome]